MDDPLRTRRDAITPVTADSSASGFADTAPVRVWAQPGGRTGELPLELTSFIDRRAETAEVKNLLATCRLVTLAGTGGVGKTRLALRAAANARRDFVDGVWIVELADVHAPSMLVEIVAATLGLVDQSDQPLLDVLIHFLSSRDTLLVLDNCEQVVAASAELVETLLLACPNLRILVTSREPLDIAGEATVRVPPLAVPDPEHEPTVRGLPKYDAVTLFADRAAAVVPGFEVSEGNKITVARICSRLEDCHWRSNSRRHGCARCRRNRSCSGSPTGTRCSPAVAAPRRPDSRRCDGASTGATSCAHRPSSGCGPGYRSSRAASNSTPPSRCAVPTSPPRRCSMCCPPWWTSRL
ncbi:ATP-binding protein [Nocardia sp. CA-084685]|uniref:ATP-binding protein n=1 Tax=Nocardia sp. CA-084685 TaxID=3239970 RepID=UPI003D9560B2